MVEIHCTGRSVGGITAGWMHSANGDMIVTVENCINYGDIYADGASYVGGVVGMLVAITMLVACLDKLMSATTPLCLQSICQTACLLAI